jgi:hypothetical protein
LSAYRTRAAVRNEFKHVANERERKPIRIAPVWGSVKDEVNNQRTAREGLNASEMTLIGNAGAAGVRSESLLALGHQDEEDPLLVDWYGDSTSSSPPGKRTNAYFFATSTHTDDPDNPLNWPLWRRWLVVLDICLLTFIIDIASPVLSPGVKLIMSEFHIGHVKATLGTTLYILGLGFGPLILSPISEIPGIGRNKPYIITLLLFTILQIPTALVQNFAGLLVLRFLYVRHAGSSLRARYPFVRFCIDAYICSSVPFCKGWVCRFACVGNGW